jgi:SSS family transporter
VTTGIVPWQGKFVIPSGEVRPGVRTAAVTALELKRTAPSFGWLNYLSLAIYLVAVFGIGLLAAGKVVNTNQFFRADQSIPWWAAGLSIFATMLSSITFMSIPAQGYGVGWNLFISSVYVVLTPLIVYVYVPFFRRLDVTSAYEYLERRFNVAVRLFASLQFILFQLGRIAVVLFLPSLALSTVAGIDLYVSIIAVGFLCVFYTMFGGMKAVIWTDAVQAIILLGGALIAIIAIVWKVPGGASQIVMVANENRKFFHTLSWTWDTSIATAWAIMIGSLFSNLFSYTASQDVVQRYLTTKDERTAGRAIWVNTIMAPLAQFLFFCIGTGLFAFYFFHPQKLDPTIANESIFPFFIVNELPPGLAGLIIAALFAASQSTISSSLNSLATAVVTDFYRRFQPNSSDASALRLARNVTLLAGVVGIGLALLLANLENVRSLWEVFLAVLGLFGGSVSGLFVLGMFSTRANGTGAIVGALTSVVVVMMMFFSGVLFWWYSVAGVFVCVTVGYLVSLLTPPKSDIGNLTVHGFKRGGERP